MRVGTKGNSHKVCDTSNNCNISDISAPRGLSQRIQLFWFTCTFSVYI